MLSHRCSLRLLLRVESSLVVIPALSFFRFASGRVLIVTVSVFWISSLV